MYGDKSLYIFWDERMQGWWRHTKHYLIVLKLNLLLSSGTELNKRHVFRNSVVGCYLNATCDYFCSCCLGKHLHDNPGNSLTAQNLVSNLRIRRELPQCIRCSLWQHRAETHSLVPNSDVLETRNAALQQNRFSSHQYDSVGSWT